MDFQLMGALGSKKGLVEVEFMETETSSKKSIWASATSEFGNHAVDRTIKLSNRDVNINSPRCPTSETQSLEE